MKSTFIFGLIFIFLSCGQKTENNDSKREKDTVTEIAHVDTTTKVPIDETISPYQQELNRAMADPTIDDYYKEIYRQEKLVPAEESKMLLIREKLFIDDADKDLFFFIVFTKSMNGADGSYSESLGVSALEFVTEKTEWFADYFNIAPKLNDQDMENWARYVCGEIQISRENQEAKAIKELENQLFENIEGRRKEYLVIIEEFIEKVKSRMH